VPIEVSRAPYGPRQKSVSADFILKPNSRAEVKNKSFILSIRAKVEKIPNICELLKAEQKL